MNRDPIFRCDHCLTIHRGRRAYKARMVSHHPNPSKGDLYRDIQDYCKECAPADIIPYDRFAPFWPA